MPKLYEDLRETIVQEAKVLIVSNGYGKLNMREVAKASGIAVGTIYNYFPTKDSLMLELMYRHWMEFIASIQLVQQEECELFTKLRGIYTLLESFLDIFKDTWLVLNGRVDGMMKEHYKQKQNVVDLFVDTVEQVINPYMPKENSAGNTTISNRELASFIVQNFILMAQMKQFEYDTFESILKSYFL